MGERLAKKLMDVVRAQGPITFAEFMRAALYDPEDGFFAGSPVGRSSHFVTSPHVSPLFAALLARMLGRSWECLDRPDGFTVVEVGAGDGTLAAQIVASAADIFPLRYVCVEQGGQARAAAGERGLRAVGSLDDLEPFQGVVLANELLDNLPLHRLRSREGALVEVFVDVQGERFVEHEGPPTEQALLSVFRRPADGEEVPASPGWIAFVLQVGRLLERGYAFVIDYGFAEDETPEPVRSYREHRMDLEVLEDPGGKDITGPVDFGALRAAASHAGLETWGPILQRDLLLELGFHGLREGLRTQQQQAEGEGRWREAVQLFSARNEAAMLLEPGGLGGHKVLALASRRLPAPPGFPSTHRE